MCAIKVTSSNSTANAQLWFLGNKHQTQLKNKPGSDKASGRKVDELENTITVTVAGMAAAEPSSQPNSEI